MKTLYLLRHAKSSWKDETLLDIERPLNGRGRRASHIIGNFLKREKIVPDLVLSSSAVRARQTTDIVMAAAKLITDLRFDERIYEADPGRLLEVVKQIEKSKKIVLLVGHNPGLEEFLMLLTGSDETMPTGALTKVVLKASNWAAIGDRGGTLEWIVRPKKLPKD
ncbi:MAG TPA: histidine phosphatase family protein [Pyrinomonadaceae bacterium]|nr:histidine phosphatase family protein [Pyrinomonadaceae bacterium]